MTATEMPQTIEPLLSIEEVARVLKLSPKAAYRLSSRGYPCYPRSSRLPNGRIITKATSVIEWIEEQGR